MEEEYIIFMNENAEKFEPNENNSLDNRSIDESIQIINENSGFKWTHQAILMLVDEYDKRKEDFSVGKISQKKLWIQISEVLKAHRHDITGPQCQSKFSGMKKTYKKIKDHNNKSGNSAKNWPYTTVMDNLMKDKPIITPISTCSSTGKRTFLKSSLERSRSCDLDDATNRKKQKLTIQNETMHKFEDRIIKNEEKKERRFQEFMAFKAQKAEEDSKYKKKALDLLERIVNNNNSL